MKKLLLATLLTIVSVGLFAQGAGKMKFKEDSHNFETIKEEAGSVSYKFVFKNTGEAPIVISDVKTSCGCTTPNWSKAPVLPGKEGFIEATYNPAHRPGPFNKTITVTSNAKDSRVVLHIMGEVAAKPRTIEDDYPRVMGNIRIKTNYISFYSITNNDVKIDTIPYINISDSDIELQFRNIPSHIKMELIPNVIKPKQKGNIVLTYDAKLKGDWGSVRDNLIFNFKNDKSGANQMLIVMANIKEDFSKLSDKEIEKAPIAEFSDLTFDFGNIKQGDKIEHTFSFKNTGKSNLLIRKIHASCGCTTVNPKSEIIKPGETSELKAIFNSAGKTGPQSKSISVTTNSPTNPVITLRLKGTVNIQ